MLGGGVQVDFVRSGQVLRSVDGSAYVVPYIRESRAAILAGPAGHSLTSRRVRHNPPSYIRMGEVLAVRYAIEDLKTEFFIPPAAVLALAVRIFNHGKIVEASGFVGGLTLVSFFEAALILDTGFSSIRRMVSENAFGKIHRVPTVRPHFVSLEGINDFMVSRRESLPAADGLTLSALPGAISASPGLVALYDKFVGTGVPFTVASFLREAESQGQILRLKDLPALLGVQRTTLNTLLRDEPHRLPPPLPTFGLGKERTHRRWSADIVKAWVAERTGQGAPPVLRTGPGRPRGSKNKPKAQT